MTIRMPILATLAAACLTAAPSSPALAGISGDYYEEFAEAACNAITTSCDILFPVLPAVTTGRFITFNQISCRMGTNQPVWGAVLRVTDGGANPRRYHYLKGDGLTGQQIFFHPLEYKVGGGPPRQMQFQFLMSPSGTGSAVCVLTGRITNN